MEWVIYDIRLWMYEVQFKILDLLLSWPGFAIVPLILFIIAVYAFPKRLNAAASVIISLFDRLSGFAMVGAASFAFLIILLQIMAVVLRYVFGLSFSWLTDSITFSFAGIFMLGAAATLREDGHVRVDILRSRFSARTCAWIELIATLFFLLPVCWLILLASMSVVSNAWAILEPFGESDGLPFKYLFLTFVPILAGLLSLQGVSIALKAVLGLRGQRSLKDLHQYEARQV
ncbi:MAG: TRAP transporter small permease subunit [Pseudomonadota bacterium]